jgi:surface polysaccharide O-acyltransferase-like enzyme
MAQRDESLTLIRFVAITLVVMVHVSAPAFVARGPSRHAGLVYDSAAHIRVPFFFMVTGVLLLG